MGLFGKTKKRIMTDVKVQEIFNDGDEEEFNVLVRKIGNGDELKKILMETNYENRNPLHMVCW